MRQFWYSRLRRALYLWFFALCLGVLGLAAAREFGEAGELSWRRIASLVVVAVMNVHALWENVALIAPPVEANGGALGTSEAAAPEPHATADRPRE
jgi:hypothetical protein